MGRSDSNSFWGMIPLRIVSVSIGSFGIGICVMFPFMDVEQGPTFWDVSTGTQLGIVGFFFVFGVLPGYWFVLNGVRSARVDEVGVHACFLVWPYRTVEWSEIESVRLSSRGICAFPLLDLRDGGKYKLLGCMGLDGLTKSPAVRATKLIRSQIQRRSE